MSEKIKTELETIFEQEKMLFPVSCKIAEAFCYKGKITFDNEYRYITYTEDLQNIQALLNESIQILSEIETKNLHPQVFEHVFNPILDQFNTLISSIRLNGWQILSKKILQKEDDLADKDMLTEILNSLVCTLGEVSKDFCSTPYGKKSIKSQIPTLQEKAKETEKNDFERSDDEYLTV